MLQCRRSPGEQPGGRSSVSHPNPEGTRMNRRTFLAGGVVLAALAVGQSLGIAQESAAGKKAVVSDRVVAGGPKDFMEVRHLILRGTNEEIGQALATIGKERYQLRP